MRDTITIVTDLVAWAIARYLYQLDELNMYPVHIDSRGAQRTGSRLGGFIGFLIARATACPARGTLGIVLRRAVEMIEQR